MNTTPSIREREQRRIKLIRRCSAALAIATLLAAIGLAPFSLKAAGRLGNAEESRSNGSADVRLRAELVGEGGRLFAGAECTRCHAAVGGVAAAVKTSNCASCHLWIAESRFDAVERERGREEFPLWDRYVERVDSFLDVPDLESAGARLDPQWVAAYLRAPYEVRPGLDEAMIRAPVSESEAHAVAAWLAARRPALAGIAAEAAGIPISARPADVAEGERLFAEQRCASCHAFGSRPASPGHRAAPDLAHARDRMRPADVAAFIADPRSLGGNPVMPDHGLSARDAARLRDFVFAAPIAARAPAAPSADLPLLTRAVRWEEVNERVFGRICVHCHMDGATEEDGDGGPGNSGGLGYEGVGLDLSSWDALRAGAVDPLTGARHSILEPAPGASEPRLVARLRARGAEHAREVAGRHAVAPSDASPGMPMGLAPLSPEDFQLVRTWIAQGARGPARPTLAKGKRR